MTSKAVASLQAEVNRLRHELQTLKVEGESTMADETMFVGQYLVERLVQLGVTVSLSSPSVPITIAHCIRRKCLVFLETSTWVGPDVRVWITAVLIVCLSGFLVWCLHIYGVNTS